MKHSHFVAVEQKPSVPPILGEVFGFSLLRHPGTSSTKTDTSPRKHRCHGRRAAVRFLFTIKHLVNDTLMVMLR